MERLSLTPFGRQPVTAGLLATQSLADHGTHIPRINKWALFRELRTAKAAYDLKDRDLMVLNALLSFHRDDDLVNDEMLVVFPSNRTLMERANGMAESTLRRHLAKLIGAGLILRHDSPNGKRYARRHLNGTIRQAFGFDLRPLLAQAQQIIEAANTARQEAELYKETRTDVVLLLRDISKFLDYIPLSEEQRTGFDETFVDLSKTLRRKLTLQNLRAVYHQAKTFRDQLKTLSETAEMSATNSQNERHKEELKYNKPDSVSDHSKSANPEICLDQIKSLCPEIIEYAPEGLSTWHDLIKLGSLLRAVLGIDENLWNQALHIMGPLNASITVSCLLQRFEQIQNPGGYFRNLVAEGRVGRFSILTLLGTLS